MIPTCLSACRSWVSPAPPSSASISPGDSSSWAPSSCTGSFESASWIERRPSRSEKNEGRGNRALLRGLFPHQLREQGQIRETERCAEPDAEGGHRLHPA